MTTLTGDKALPKRCSEIRQMWRRYLPAYTDFSGGALGWIVSHVMAPPSRGAIPVIEALANEWGVRLELDLHTLPLDAENPRRLRQEYPLFATIKDSLDRDRQVGGSDRERAIRQMHIALFGHFEGSEVKIYYDQLRRVRNCLDSLGALMPAPSPDWHSTAQAAYQMLQQQHDQATLITNEEKELLRQFGELLTGERNVGERRGSGGGGRRQGTRPATETLGDKPLHDHRFGHRYRSRSGARRGNSPPLGRTDRDDPTLAAPGTNKTHMTVGGTTARTTAATDDAESAFAIEFEQDSTIPPKDAKRIARIIADRASEHTTLSAADPSLLTDGQVRDALAILANAPVRFLYAWLVLTTTIDPERLMRLTKTTTEPADEAPHFNGSRLAYRLKNGPTAGAHDNSNQMVEIVLPTPIARYLSTWGGRQPFAGQRGPIDARLAYRLSDSPGATPTLRRLRKTGAFQLEQLTQARTQAQILSGGFNFAHIVPGTYRRFDAGGLQALFARHNRTLADRLLAISPAGNGLRPWLENLKVREDSTRPPTGSARALPPEAYRPVFKRLHAAELEAVKAITRAPIGNDHAAKARTEALRLLAARTYLAFVLGTGARPIAERALAARAGKGVQSNQHALLWLRDKDSQAYGEARVLPIANDLGKALDQLDASVNDCAATLKTAGWRIMDARDPGREDLPAWIALRRGQIAVIEVFTNAELARVLTAYAIDDPRPSPNATRHTVSTALDHTLDEASVHAVMGHSGAGGTYFHAESLASLDMGAVKKALATVLNRAGFRVS